MNLDEIMGYVQNKVVMVTGGGDLSEANFADRSRLIIQNSWSLWIFTRIMPMISSRTEEKISGSESGSAHRFCAEYPQDE